jgi:hypothetical protein
VKRWLTAGAWKLTLSIWLAIVLACSTDAVGEFVTGFYRRHLHATLWSYGITSHDAQKFLHVVLFSLLGWLLAYTDFPPRPAWVRGLVWSFAAGAASESIQLLAQGREPLLSDVLLNGVAGAVTCWLVLRFAARRPAAA